MKKKIINGILMVALLVATTTSFVSCKDYDEDVKTDLTAQLQKLNGDYLAADAALNKAIQAQLANKADSASFWNFKKNVEDNYATKQELKDSLEKYATLGYVDAETQRLWDALNDTKDANSVASKLAAINDAISGENGINNQISDINGAIENVNSQLKSLKDQIDTIVDALRNMVTSVTVNAVSNGIISNSKVYPGLDMQLVGAVYGEPINAKGAFPSKESGLSDAALAGVESLDGYYKWEDGELITTDKDGYNAGKIYFTLNPSNINPNNLKALSLVNSQNKEIFTLGEVTKSNDVLTWGITRADGDTFEPTLWEAPVKYDVNSVKALELKNIVNFSALKNNVKNIINEVKNVDSKSTAKSAAKNVLKETASAVANLLNSKIPAMPAVALKATWEDTVGVRSVLSDYSIAATAYKPLSFSEFNGVSLGTDINFTKVDNAFKKIIDNVRKELNGINLSGLRINKINITEEELANYNKSKYVMIYIYQNYAAKTVDDGDEDPTNDKTLNGVLNDLYIDLWTSDSPIYDYEDYRDANGNGTVYEFRCVYMDADMREAISSLINGKINGTLESTDKAIQDVVDQVKNVIKKANDGLDKVESLENSVTDYLESFINRTANFVSTGRFLEPILLVNTSKGIARATGTYEAGKYIFVPTTMSYELIAPAFKKYIAVLDKDGKVIAGSQKILTKGDKDFSSVEINLTKDAAKVVYAAMDFRGYQVAKVYNVTVE